MPLNMQDPEFEFALVSGFVGLVPTGDEKLVLRERFGDPTTPTSWEGSGEHVVAKLEEFGQVLEAVIPRPTKDEPSSRPYSKRPSSG